MRHQSIAYLRSKVSTTCFEEIASELRTVVGNDAIRDPKSAHEALDELDRRAGRDDMHWLYFHPLGELVDGDN